MMIDTAGLDDSELGKMRIAKSLEVLAKTDLALLVIDGQTGVGALEEEVVRLCQEKKITLIGVINKIDKLAMDVATQASIKGQLGIEHIVTVSALTKSGISELKSPW